MAVPTKFTDASLEKEKSNLTDKINGIEKSNIDLDRSLDMARNRMAEAQSKLDDYRQRDREHRERKQRSEGVTVYGRESLQEYAIASLFNSVSADLFTDDIEKAKKEVSEAQKNVSSIHDSISENHSNLTTYNAQLRDINVLLQKPEEQRVEEHYQSLIAKKGIANDTDIFAELIKEFRELGEYKDAKAQAEECFNLGLKSTYDNLVKGKRKLDSSEWAVPEHYMALAKFLREMDGYADTEELANDCDKRYRECKERREEQERIEKEERERREEQERIEQKRIAEQERIKKEQEQKEQEERRRREAEERERRRIEKERKRQFWTVFSVVSGGTVGGLIASAAVAADPSDHPELIVLIMIIFMIPSGICGWKLNSDDESHAVGCGCCGVIIGAIIGAFIAFLSSGVSLFVGILVGVVGGAVIGYLINKK
jgi:hypothetical protein